jgi:putative addiction module CopG family antidote
MHIVNLPPELERFATEAVASGRYRTVADVVAAGVTLLRRHEQARDELLASVLAAKAASDRDGYLAGDDVAAQGRATIALRADAAARGGPEFTLGASENPIRYAREPATSPIHTPVLS